MKKIIELNDNLKEKILKFLYKNEIYNMQLIDLIHNNKVKELFIAEENEEILAVLHFNYDGNSYFTNFAYENGFGLNEIIDQLKKVSYPKILLAGKSEEVVKILKSFGKDLSSNDFFYKFEGSVNGDLLNLNVRMAEENRKDINILRAFYIDFFGAETEEEKREIGEESLLVDDIREGVYYLQLEDKIIGMVRICARTENYGEITGVYIHPDFRGKNYGEVIVGYVVNSLLKEGRYAVLQADSTNIPAIKTYEKLGFKKICDYSFEFLT